LNEHFVREVKTQHLSSYGKKKSGKKYKVEGEFH